MPPLFSRTRHVDYMSHRILILVLCHVQIQFMIALYVGKVMSLINCQLFKNIIIPTENDPSIIVMIEYIYNHWELIIDFNDYLESLEFYYWSGQNESTAIARDNILWHLLRLAICGGRRNFCKHMNINLSGRINRNWIYFMVNNKFIARNQLENGGWPMEVKKCCMWRFSTLVYGHTIKSTQQKAAFISELIWHLSAHPIRNDIYL